MMSPEAAAGATGGTLLRRGEQPCFCGASCDSRSVAPGQAFFAITGPRFDGHDYWLGAAAAGASLLVVSRPPLAAAPAELPAGTSILLVRDTRRALADLARAWLVDVGPRVVAITGSAGKTTTKELVRAICSQAGPTHANRGNLNNDIGLPMTLLEMPRATRYLVVEMGMNKAGEIRYLARICRPEVGVITCIAPVHLEGLGSLEAIAAAKAELLEELASGGVAVVPAAEPLLEPLLGRSAARDVIRFGGEARPLALTETATASDTGTGPVTGARTGAEVGAGAGSRAEVGARNALPWREEINVVLEATRPLGARGVLLRLLLGEAPLEVLLPLPGAHNALNAAAAAAAGLALGLPASAIAAGLTLPPALEHRSAVLEIGPWHVLDDCYNANPAAMKAALDTLSQLAAGAPAIAVLGEMLELGPDSEQFHLEVGRHAAGSDLETLITVGPAAAAIARGAARAGLEPSRIVVADEVTGAGRELARRAPAGSWILVKASRGARLEGVIDALRTQES